MNKLAPKCNNNEKKNYPFSQLQIETKNKRIIRRKQGKMIYNLLVLSFKYSNLNEMASKVDDQLLIN